MSEDQPVYTSEGVHLKDGSQDFGDFLRGVANETGFMKLDLPPGYSVKVSAQSNDDHGRQLTVLDYETGKNSNFFRQHEGERMQYLDDGVAKHELDLGTVGQVAAGKPWPVLGLQFAHRDGDKASVPRIMDAPFDHKNGKLTIFIVSEDSTNGVAKDTIATVKLARMT